MFRSVARKLLQGRKSFDSSAWAGFCTKFETPRPLHPIKEVNDVKLVGNIVKDPIVIASGHKLLSIKTRQSPTRYCIHQVYVNPLTNFARGQRVFVNGSIVAAEIMINGKILTGISIRGKSVITLENESASTNLHEGDKNVANIVASVASNVSTGADNDSFAVASHHFKRNENGEDEQKAHFYRVFIYDDALRQYVQKNINKSDRVQVQGTIGYNKHITDEGKKYRSGYIIANNITKILRRSKSESVELDGERTKDELS